MVLVYNIDGIFATIFFFFRKRGFYCPFIGHFAFNLRLFLGCFFFSEEALEERIYSKIHQYDV